MSKTDTDVLQRLLTEHLVVLRSTPVKAAAAVIPEDFKNCMTPGSLWEDFEITGVTGDEKNVKIVIDILINKLYSSIGMKNSERIGQCRHSGDNWILKLDKGEILRRGVVVCYTIFLEQNRVMVIVENI